MDIKVVTLNIWLGGTLQEEYLQFLKAQDADILLLQEVNNGEDAKLKPQYRSMQVLKQQLKYPYEIFVPEYLDITHTDGKAQTGNAILSKFPITSSDITDFLPYTEEYQDVEGNYHNCPYNMLHVTLDTPVGKLEVFNMHGVWDLDGDNFSPLRQKMSKLVISAVEGKERVILAGDTNARPTNKAMVAIGEHLRSVFGHELKSTFNMRHKENPGYATSVVDAMYVSSDIEVLEHDCPDVNVSDHMPLTARLRVKS
jgi:endonuclease/exonuclease/phosphatase family metal-dependent hydrolase